MREGPCKEMVKLRTALREEAVHRMARGKAAAREQTHACMVYAADHCSDAAASNDAGMGETLASNATPLWGCAIRHGSRGSDRVWRAGTTGEGDNGTQLWQESFHPFAHGLLKRVRVSDRVAPCPDLLLTRAARACGIRGQRMAQFHSQILDHGHIL